MTKTIPTWFLLGRRIKTLVSHLRPAHTTTKQNLLLEQEILSVGKS